MDEARVNKMLEKIEKLIVDGNKEVIDRLERVEYRLGSVETRIDGVEGKLGNLEAGQAELKRDVKAVDKKVDMTYNMLCYDIEQVDHKFDNLDRKLDEHIHLAQTR